MLRRYKQMNTLCNIFLQIPLQMNVNAGLDWIGPNATYFVFLSCTTFQHLHHFTASSSLLKYVFICMFSIIIEIFLKKKKKRTREYFRRFCSAFSVLIQILHNSFNTTHTRLVYIKI